MKSNFSMKETIKEKVLKCLELYPDSRNSDVKLTNAVWVEFYHSLLFIKDGVLAVKLLDIYKLPNQDIIKRWRAKIQNEEGKFLPTDPEITKKRQRREEQIRKDLNYNPEMRKV